MNMVQRSINEVRRGPRRKPDASTHDPDPAYLRSLIADAGLSIRATARRLGISERMMRYYVADEAGDHRSAPYAVQYALEALAKGGAS